MVASALAHGAAVGHLARRGMSAAQEYFTQAANNPQLMQKLQQDAELYEQTPGAGIEPEEMLPVLITFFIIMIVVTSISYTVGDVMTALAMIESPASVAIIEPKPPAYQEYADEPDAPLEKEPLVQEETDVEVTVVHTKPITAKLTTTMAHLQRVGGFFSRWRGLHFAIGYSAIHSLVHSILTVMTGGSLFMHILFFILTSVLLAQIHMLWTHSMVAKPMNGRNAPRMVARKDCKALVMPTIIHAIAQQALIWVPVGVAFGLGLTRIEHGQLIEAAQKNDCHALISVAARLLAVGASALLVALVILLPATATLTRIETALLPEDYDTIVPFDRDAVLGDLDLSVAADRKALVHNTWRSFDWAARVRVIKLLVKGVLLQLSVVFVGIHLMVGEVYLIGGDRLGVFFKSASAQIQLMLIEAHNAQ